MNIPVRLHDELTLGQHKLSTRFGSSPPRIFAAGEIAETAAGWGIYRLRSGWACQFRGLGSGRRAIVDVYLPGDVIGLDALLRNRPLKDVLTLSSVTVEAVSADGLIELMADRSAALYLTWLLGQRQRRADRLLAAISGLDARGRIATMALDFHARLHRRRLITGASYNFPLTQIQIGNYLGLTTVHVNRVLRSLRDERIVNFEKHSVTILDLERLTILSQHGGTGSSNADGGKRPVHDAAD